MHVKSLKNQRLFPFTYMTRYKQLMGAVVFERSLENNETRRFHSSVLRHYDINRLRLIKEVIIN